jgi:hypothetical protein
MKKALWMIVMGAAMMAPVAASARPLRVLVAPGFGWGWYSPYWGAYAYPYYGYYGYGPATGTVKFDTKVKDAEIYINGAYAGTTGKLKNLNLRPGSYDIEIRTQGRTEFDQKVYVTAGKTLHLNPEL